MKKAKQMNAPQLIFVCVCYSLPVGVFFFLDCFKDPFLSQNRISNHSKDTEYGIRHFT